LCYSASGCFDDAAQNGYAVLTGNSDKARYTLRASAGQKWLDLVRGKTACEARFALDDAWIRPVLAGCMLNDTPAWQ
jgi:hypothetical protein